MKFVFVFTRVKIIEQSIIWATKRDRHQQLSFTELCNVQVSSGSKKHRDQALEYSKVVFQQSLNMSHVHFFGPFGKYYSQIVTKKERNWKNVAPHKCMAEAGLGFCMIIVIQHHPTATPLDHDYLVITWESTLVNFSICQLWTEPYHNGQVTISYMELIN